MMVMGVKFNSFKVPPLEQHVYTEATKEVISFLKAKLSYEDFEEYFQIFLDVWEEPYTKFVPHFTKEELKAVIDSVPIATRQELEERYKGESEKLKMALSYLD